MEQDGAGKFGFYTCLALVVGNFIGSGIFLLPAQLAPLGWNAIFAWFFTIGGALCLAYVFARLTREIPRTAGPYAFVEQAFGRIPGFAVAWSYWIALWVANAALAVAAVSYLSYFIPSLAATPGLGALATAAILWLITGINIVSVRLTGSVQLLTTVLKLLPLIAVVLISILAVADGSAKLQTPMRAEDLSFSAISAAATLTLWAMLGVEVASVGSRNIADPERNVPRATLIGTFLVGVIYILVSMPVALLLPANQIATSNAPLADFVATFWTPQAAAMVGLFAAISCIGALNGWILLQGELPLAMAQHGVFPSWFGKLSRAGTPLRAQVLSSICATILIAANADRNVAGLFVFMILLATASTLFLYLGCALAAIRLQQLGSIRRSTGLTLIASLGALFSVWTFFGAGLEATGWGVLLLATGIPVYMVMRRGAPSPAPEAAPAAPPGSSA